MNGPANDAPDGQFLVFADQDVSAVLTVGSQNNAFRRVGQLLDREIAINYGDDNALIYRINRAINYQEVAVVNTKAGH